MLAVLPSQASTTPYVGSWYVDEEVSEGEQSSGIIRTQFTFEQDMSMDMVIVVLLSSDIGEGMAIEASLGGDAVGKWELASGQLKMHLDAESFEMSDTEVELQGVKNVDPTNVNLMKQAVADQLRSEFYQRFKTVVEAYGNSTFTVVSVDENQLVVVDESNEQTTLYRLVAEE